MRRSTAVVVFVVLCMAGVAVAEPEGADAQRARAVRLTEEGSQLFAARNFPSALQKFEQAYEAFPSANLRFNVGRAALEADQPLTAAASFQAFLEQSEESPALHGSRVFAEEKLLALRTRVSRLRVEPTPQDAHVELDDAPLKGRAAFVAPGPHRIKVDAPGHTPAERVVTMAAGEDRTFELVLVPERLAAPTRPPALDAVAPALPPRHASPAPWILLGAGGASLVGSGVFGILASSNDAKLRRVVEGTEPGARSIDGPALRSTVRTQAWSSTVTLGVGVVAASVGAVLLFTRGTAPDHLALDGQAESPVALRF
jgi:hypothetical protein